MSSAEVVSPAGTVKGPALSVLSGFLLALAYPRPGLSILGLIALVPLLLACAGARPRAALFRGYSCGAAFFAVLLYWIPRVMVVYGGLPWPVAGLIMALLVGYLAAYFALFAWGTAVAWSRCGPSALVGTPVLWVALELARARLLTGFPWGLLGYSQSGNLPLMQAAALGGVYAVSFLVLAANAGTAVLLIRPAPRGARAAGLLLLLLVALAEAGGLLAMREEGIPQMEGVTVAAVQGNVPEGAKWDPSAAAVILEDLEGLTHQAALRKALLVVWPESASPFTFRGPSRRGPEESAPGERALYEVLPRRDYIDRVTGLARRLDTSLIIGSVDYEVREGDLVALNSAFAVGSDGRLGPSYDKVHLVPFGEYVPLDRLLFFVNRMVRGAIAGFAPGRKLDPLPSPLGPAATYICYEAIFPELVRSIAARGAVILVNITNDAWFGQSAAPDQHLAMAAVRSIENRRYLVRAANTGVSAIVDPYGRVLARADLGTRAVVVGSIEARHDTTLYARTGDLLAWACVILTLLHAAALRAARQRPS